MSATRETIVSCDGCGENHNGDDRYMKAWEIRAKRKREGWTHIGTRDYCPKCTDIHHVRRLVKEAGV